MMQDLPIDQLITIAGLLFTIASAIGGIIWKGIPWYRKRHLILTIDSCTYDYDHGLLKFVITITVANNQDNAVKLNRIVGYKNGSELIESPVTGNILPEPLPRLEAGDEITRTLQLMEQVSARISVRSCFEIKIDLRWNASRHTSKTVCCRPATGPQEKARRDVRKLRSPV